MVSRYIPNHQCRGQAPEQSLLDFPPKSEAELMRVLALFAGKNDAGEIVFAGGGAYDHSIPSVADLASSLRNILTSYTQYQPELTQGYLMILFAYQTMIAELTGMDLSTGSLYEGGTALAEAALMAMRITGRNKVVVAPTIHPSYRQTLETYLAHGRGARIATLPYDVAHGRTEWHGLAHELEGDTAACVIVQQPNFCGVIEEITTVAEAAHKHGTLLVVSQYPVSLGMLKTPGEIGADIAVGELQSLGLPLAFGGPYAGYLATKTEHIENTPGRMVEETVDLEGKRAYVLTLTKREQHIRRKRATSNICSNQALCTARVAATLGAWGAKFPDIAKRCYDNAHYIAEAIAQFPGIRLAFGNSPFFNEFAFECACAGTEELLRKNGFRILAGGRAEYADLLPEGTFMVATTEKHSQEELDRFIGILASLSLKEIGHG